MQISMSKSACFTFTGESSFPARYDPVRISQGVQVTVHVQVTVQVTVHVHLYMYTCTCTLVHVHLYKSLYMYTCTSHCTCTLVQVTVHVHLYSLWICFVDFAALWWRICCDSHVIYSESMYPYARYANYNEWLPTCMYCIYWVRWLLWTCLHSNVCCRTYLSLCPSICYTSVFTGPIHL